MIQVIVKDKESELDSMKHGVSPGTIQGPALFITDILTLHYILN